MNIVKDTELQTTTIENKILTIRNQQVMIDRDLAELYGVETKRLNEQVKRNIERFPDRFMFQLTEEEINDLSSRSQIATLNINGNKRGSNIKYLPYAFTEQGVAMLSAVLKSDTAVKVSIQIMDAFVAMRHFLLNNAQIFSELTQIKRHQLESDKKIEELFEKMDKYGVEQTQGIFFQGQIFDAYSFFQKLIQKAQKEIILIDGYNELFKKAAVYKPCAKVGAALEAEKVERVTNNYQDVLNALPGAKNKVNIPDLLTVDQSKDPFK